jgi:hypothetical protein
MSPSEQFSGTMIRDLCDKAEAEIRANCPDIMTYSECHEAAERYLAQHHPGLETKTHLGQALCYFIVGVAANVAWDCAAEATQRAKHKKPDEPKKEIKKGSLEAALGGFPDVNSKRNYSLGE